MAILPVYMRVFMEMLLINGYKQHFSAFNDKMFSILQCQKEVLFKAVVQAIPSYVICIFKLPKTYCDSRYHGSLSVSNFGIL